MNRVIQILAALAAAACGFLFGQMDGLMYALIAFMVLDYVSGVLVAIAQHELSSKIGFKGIAKKVIILILVAVGHILDVHILGGGAVCRSAVCGLYIANEGISILENNRYGPSPCHHHGCSRSILGSSAPRRSSQSRRPASSADTPDALS